jgi:hypothetical protein
MEFVMDMNSLYKKTFTGQLPFYVSALIVVGKNGEVGQKLAEYEDEEIIFQDGLFTSVSCEPYNFGSSPYNTKVVDDKIHFDTVTESPTHGKIAWQGIIDGEQVEVTFVWTKERWYWDTRREYWFKGKLKK